ncbi:glycosyltransferase family 2 protein [Psychromarinibacter sp. S121]|uniref:glycosyltransferase family 2 protein n=1 Tax=Psychromarinibacter sp. S121 TaxID=3415127 RepID=UPI003C7DDA96
MPSPSFTVIIISYHQEDCIAECIESVLAQTAFDSIAEILVVDDASTDGSVEAAEKAAEGQSKVRIVRRETNSGGAAAPRNDGLRIAKGSHIAFLDGDDIWLPHKLETELAVLEKHPGVGLIYCDFVTFSQDYDDRRTVCTHVDADDTNQLAKIFVRGGPILPSCAVVSAEAVRAAGLMNENLRFNEEQEFWLRILTTSRAQHIREALVRRRAWEGSLGSVTYGLENIACKREITRIMLNLQPDLERVAPKREAQIEFKTAVHYFRLNDKASARAHLRKAIALDGSLRKARLYLAISYVTARPETFLTHARHLASRARSLSLGGARK